MKTAWVVVVVALARPAPAHDFWIQPETFFPARDRQIAVRLFVGDGFVKENERAFEKQATPKLQLLSGERTTDLLSLGKEGKAPFVAIALPTPGHHWIAVERERKTIRLEAAKFNDYLREEGLDDVLDKRRLAGEDQKPGRERYSRCLKALLLCEKGDDGWKKTGGQRLEIVPLTDPYAIEVGGTLKVRLLFEGKPLAKAPLFALNRNGEKVTKEKLTTDKDGTAEVKLSRKGVWLLRMVHMRRCADPVEADWESFWTALTFAVR